MKIRFVLLFVVISSMVFARSPKREFRGVWVATVENIDWPSKPGLSTDEQKAEIISILDMHKANGMNAVIFQVRPAADAFYPSPFEPWSRYLTGTPGQAPSPYYDPFQTWIEEAHRRGMELHAWCNPYRVAQKADQPLAGDHVAFKHPDWILSYGKKLYYDPGNPEAQEFVTNVIGDIVARYDVDAIHFDDYFYPYQVPGEAFPDSASFRKYNTSGFNDIADWRRNNVDVIIRMLSEKIRQTKPWVRFGISPFGVWRNKKDDPRGSDTKAGTTNYDQLYADILKWMENDWIDYVTPQLYWQIGHPTVDFKTLCDWWADHSYGKDVYIGQAAYRVDPKSSTEEWKTPGEIEKQINYLRNNDKINGSVYFSSKSFTKDLLGLTDNLRNDFYKYPALVPPTPKNSAQKPYAPRIKKGCWKKIKWEPSGITNSPGETTKYVVYLNRKGEPFHPEKSETLLKVTCDTKVKLRKTGDKKQIYEVRVSALDRMNNESEPSEPIRIKL